MATVVDAVIKWEAFEAEQGAGSLTDFARWLLTSGHALPASVHTAGDRSGGMVSVDDPLFERATPESQYSAQASYLIARLGRILRTYFKPLVQRHGLNSSDDFGFLASADWYGTIGKKELCQKNLFEMTTGGEIIRRLVQLGYVTESINPADRRGKLIKITELGKQHLYQIYQEAQELPDTLAMLGTDDRKLLVGWMRQLDMHHTTHLEASTKPASGSGKS